MLDIICIYRKEDKVFLQDMLKTIPSFAKTILVETIPTDRRGWEIKTNKNVTVNEKMSAYVLEYPKGQFRFDTARNIANTLAKQKYIMTLDADERLLPFQHQELEGLLFECSKDDNILGLQTRNYSYTSTIMDSVGDISTEVGKQIKIYRNLPDIKFESMVHESVLSSIRRAGGEVVDTAILIFHTGYAADIIEVGNKLERNIDLLIKQGDITLNNKSLKQKLFDSIIMFEKIKETKKWQ